MGQVQIIDARVAGASPRYVTGARKGKRRAYRALRTLSAIDAVGLHHLGPHLSSEPKPGQTIEERAVWRALRQPYHLWVQESLVVLAWDFRVVTWHGNGLNRRSVGVVVAGNFPALELDRAELHDDAEPFGPALAVALGIVRAELLHVRLLLTHSQAARKPADPGEMIARMATAAGQAMHPPLLPVPGFTIGNGRPWPPAWSRPLGYEGEARRGAVS